MNKQTQNTIEELQLIIAGGDYMEIYGFIEENYTPNTEVQKKCEEYLDGFGVWFSETYNYAPIEAVEADIKQYKTQERRNFCNHNWVDATNEVVSGTDVCTLCGKSKTQKREEVQGVK